jgi:hypothetical protein
MVLLSTLACVVLKVAGFEIKDEFEGFYVVVVF